MFKVKLANLKFSKMGDGPYFLLFGGFVMRLLILLVISVTSNPIHIPTVFPLKSSNRIPHVLQNNGILMGMMLH